MLDIKRAEFRRQFIALTLRRVRPGSGSSVAFLRARTWVNAVSDLTGVLGLFVVVGDVATRLYMPERVTLDLDILILAGDAATVYGQLEEAGGRRVGALGLSGELSGSQWELADGTSLNVLASDEGWVGEALAGPSYGPDGVPVIGLPYLVLMKVKASRTQDLADVSRMLGGADEGALALVRGLLGGFCRRRWRMWRV